MKTNDYWMEGVGVTWILSKDTTKRKLFWLVIMWLCMIPYIAIGLVLVFTIVGAIIGFPLIIGAWIAMAAITQVGTETKEKLTV